MCCEDNGLIRVRCIAFPRSQWKGQGVLNALIFFSKSLMVNLCCLFYVIEYICDKEKTLTYMCFYIQ